MSENPESKETNTEAPAEPERRPVAPLRWWRASQRRWWSRWLVQLALVVIIVTMVGFFQARHLISRGDPAPGFALRDLDGQAHALEDYRGKTLLLAFMAPWCSVCGLEASNLRAVSDDDPSKVVVGVMVDYETLEDAKAFVEEHDIRFPVLLGDGRIHQEYNVKSFPTLYVIGEDGSIRHSVVGYTTWVGLKVRLAL